MNPDVLKMRSFRFAAPAEGRCDLLVIAGEHSGDEQSARMVSDALKLNPNLKICAFGGEKLSECGAQLLFDMTSFSVVGLVEVLKNYGFFKKLSEAVVDWIGKYRPKAVCFVDYPGFNLHIASILKQRGISQKGGGSVKLLYYISPQIWAWKASRRFKMAELLDSLAVIFPFETKCYADTNLDTHFVGHPFLSDSYQPPVVYDPAGEILLLSGSREIAVSRIFPVMCGALEKIDGAKAVAIYPTERIKNILEKEISRRPILKDRVRIVPNGGSSALAAKAVMMSSGTMSLACSLQGIPGAIVYKANPFTYFVGRALVKIKYLSIANILLDKPAWREFIQFDASAAPLAEYMQDCLKPSARKNFAEYAKTLKGLLHSPPSLSAAQWLCLKGGF